MVKTELYSLYLLACSLCFLTASAGASSASANVNKEILSSTKPAMHQREVHIPPASANSEDPHSVTVRETELQTEAEESASPTDRETGQQTEDPKSPPHEQLIRGGESSFESQSPPPQQELSTPESSGETESPTDEQRLSPYFRLNYGWGWQPLNAPENNLSPHRLGLALGAGVRWGDFLVGLDFNYFFGSRFLEGSVTHDPTIRGEGRFNSYRLALDLGYNVDIWRFSVQPHLLVGLDWQRLQIGETVFPVTRSTLVTPALLLLYNLKPDGTLALGLDTRYNVLIYEGEVRSHFSNFLTLHFGF